MRTLMTLALSLLIAACSTPQNEETSSVSFTGEAPYLFTDNAGTTYLSWTEAGESENQLKFSTYNKGKWSEPQIIAKGSNWFVNWADYPVIVTKNGTNFMSHFLAKSSEGTYSYDVTVKHSTNSGKDWSEAYVLHDDGKSAEHGFVTMVPYGENFFVTWLDGRNTVTGDTTSHAGHGGGGPMTLRAAIVSPQGEKINEWELDSKVCDCCQTTAVITDNGPVVAYRDRSDDEIRDMSVVRWVDNQWTAPQTLHEDGWKIAGCPVNGPRLSAAGNTIAAAWFSAAEGVAEVKVKFSKDGGASFGNAIKVSKDAPIGRVDIEMLDKNTALVSWMEGSDIVAAKVKDSGEIVEQMTVASSSQSRSSGFPQLTKNNNQLIFAWTDSEKQEIKVKTVPL